MTKDKLLVFKIISVVAFLLSLFAAAQLLFPQEISGLDISSLNPAVADLSTIGYAEVTPDASVAGDIGAVSLSSRCYQVTANTDAAQAQSIMDGIAGRIGARPNTHDIMKEILDAYGIEILMVKVVDLKENNYIGKLIVKQGNNVLRLDSRPSDGIALAVRTNATIYFKESLLQQQGKNIC